ncbi:MAG: hypothetical protein QHH15_07875 [Candidatus Thermoplasmatota archaeon]|nr:hypothetical protein [Candidatus Thermoplasmatota archaeon]
MNKKILELVLGVVIISLLLGTSVNAIQTTTQNKYQLQRDGYWYESFDSYEAGSPLHGQGGWAAWDNNPCSNWVYNK